MRMCVHDWMFMSVDCGMYACRGLLRLFVCTKEKAREFYCMCMRGGLHVCIQRFIFEFECVDCVLACACMCFGIYV